MDIINLPEMDYMKLAPFEGWKKQSQFKACPERSRTGQFLWIPVFTGMTGRGRDGAQQCEEKPISVVLI